MKNENTTHLPDPEDRGSSIIVRKAMHWEASAINELIRDSMATYCSLSGINEDELDSLRETVDDIVGSMCKSVVLVAVDHTDTILGTARLYFRDAEDFSEAKLFEEEESLKESRVAYLTRFSVMQSTRGRGIGGQLIATAENIARSEGIRLLLLHTALSNEAVSGFYLKKGFFIDSVDLSRGYPRALFMKFTS
ncbi:MAG: GNAT family N-acetyltransferase [Clostridiales bacterium]|nr:GNAT family N-acetyltransferase [Clostridiales bacterium]